MPTAVQLIGSVDEQSRQKAQGLLGFSTCRELIDTKQSLNSIKMRGEAFVYLENIIQKKETLQISSIKSSATDYVLIKLDFPYSTCFPGPVVQWLIHI